MWGLGDPPLLEKVYVRFEHRHIFILKEGINKDKKYKTKEVGKITKEVAKKCRIENYEDFPILQSLGLPFHTSKHANDFNSVDNYNETLSNINIIIKKPYYVKYNKDKNSLQYYGKIKQYTCVIVNILENNAYVSTMYPINKAKIDKIKNKK